MQNHITVLSILYIVFSGFGLIAAAIVLAIFAGGSLFLNDDTATPIVAAIGTAISMFLAVTSIPGLVGGIGLLKRHEWARILVLILGFLNLILFPFGTALGIYTIWALMNSEIIKLFAQGSATHGAVA